MGASGWGLSVVGASGWGLAVVGASGWGLSVVGALMLLTYLLLVKYSWFRLKRLYAGHFCHHWLVVFNTAFIFLGGGRMADVVWGFTSMIEENTAIRVRNVNSWA